MIRLPKKPRSRRKKLTLSGLLWIVLALILFAYNKYNPEGLENLLKPPPVAVSLREEGKVRVCFWNVKNYLDTYRIVDKKRVMAPKPESEKMAIIDVLKQIEPDILGLAEMGGKPNLLEFQGFLKKHGFDYPFYALSGNNPEHPNCAILSKIPFKAETKGKGKFSYFQEDLSSHRGILLAKFDSPQEWRFGVIHLKSRFGSKKRDPEYSDFRALEVQEILKDIAPFKSKLILFCGDFNDRPDDKAPAVLKKNAFFVLKEKQSVPTYIWKKEKIYYRFDFFMASKPMLEICSESESTGVIEAASDHAPIFTDIDFSRN